MNRYWGVSINLPSTLWRYPFSRVFRPKYPKVEITVRFDAFLDPLCDVDNFVGDDPRLLKLSHGEVKVVGTHLLDVTGGDPGCQYFIIRVNGYHSYAGLGAEQSISCAVI